MTRRPTRLPKPNEAAGGLHGLLRPGHLSGPVPAAGGASVSPGGGLLCRGLPCPAAAGSLAEAGAADRHGPGVGPGVELAVRLCRPGSAGGPVRQVGDRLHGPAGVRRPHGLRCQGDGEAGGVPLGQGGLLRRGGPAGPPAGPDGDGPGEIPGRRPAPGGHHHQLHLPGSVPAGLPAGRGCCLRRGLCRLAPLVAGPGRPGHAGPRGRAVRRGRGGLFERHPHRGYLRPVGGGPLGPVGGGTEPHPGGIRHALRLSHDADPAGDGAAPAASAGSAGTAHPGVLYHSHRGQPLGGPGLHHGGVCAGGAAVPAGQRPAYHPVCRPVPDFAGQPLRRSLHQSAAVLRGHGGTAVADAEDPGPAAGGEIQGKGVPAAGLQPFGHRGGHGVHSAPVRRLLRLSGADLAGEQPAVPDSLQCRVHAGIADGAGQLPLAAPGSGDRLPPGPADQVHSLDFRGAGVPSLPRGVSHQPVSEILAGVPVRPVRRRVLPAAPGPAEIRCSHGPGGHVPGGDGVAGRAPLHPQRLGRLCAGCGPGGERAAVLRRAVRPGGLRQPQQLVRRRRHRGGSFGHHGLRDPGLPDPDPL